MTHIFKANILPATKAITLIFVLSIMLIQGCSTTPTSSPEINEPTSSTKTSSGSIKKKSRNIPPELSHLPHDVFVKVPLDVHLALIDRNVYVNTLGAMKILNRESCPIEISSHRGDFRFPESSAEAIAASNMNGFDGAEIDLRKLRDGIWVNYHDSETGRAAVHYTGQRMVVESMTSEDWHGLKIRDKSTNELLDKRPIDAYQAFKMFSESAMPGQHLKVMRVSRTLLILTTHLRHFLDSEITIFQVLKLKPWKC